MALILLVLLLALLLGGLGFVLHILWWIALVVLVLWLVGFLVCVAKAAPAAAGTDGDMAVAERASRPWRAPHTGHDALVPDARGGIGD